MALLLLLLPRKFKSSRDLQGIRISIQFHLKDLFLVFEVHSSMNLFLSVLLHPLIVFMICSKESEENGGFQCVEREEKSIHSVILSRQ